MAQNDYGNPQSPFSGAQLNTTLRNWRDALHTLHRGASRPSYAQGGTLWVREVSSTNWELTFYDGADDIVVATINPSANTITPAGAATPADLQTRVAKAGDTMTGLLALSGAPTATNHAATKAYVDTGDGARVAKAGDTMTGFLTLHANPTAAMHAVPKQYVDRGTAGPVTASGAAVDFTNIPAWANQVRVIGTGVVTTSAMPRLRVGGTSILTTGYTGAGSSTSTAVNSASSTTDFVFFGSEFATTYNFVLTLIKAPASDVWLFQGNGSYPSAPGTLRGTGWINVNATLEQLRIFVSSGTFSSGNLWAEWRR